jgi:hypothetical protein
MRKRMCLVLLEGLFLAAGLCFAQGQLPRLRVSENGRYLVKQDGSPFFYLADTAWGLFHFNRDDLDHYLKTRAGQHRLSRPRVRASRPWERRPRRHWASSLP